MLKRKMRNIHPGEILREEIINVNGLTVTDAARMLGITRTTLSNIVNGKSDLSAEMCYRIAFVFGGSATVWANLQTKYDLASAEPQVRMLNLVPYQPKASA